MLPAVRPHVDAVIAVLEGAGLTVGNHASPDPRDPLALLPYTIVHIVAGGEVDGTLASPDDYVDFRVQTMSVGSGPEQAMWQADRVRAALDGATLAVAGRAVQRVRLLTASAGVRIDTDVTPHVFYSVDVWGLWSYPS